tara:strand:- start:1512 stop:1799 length:288 start_codon:yes stop_codon:yes gene_type:complete
VNTIKKYKLLIVTILLIFSKSHALSPELEKQLYIGCYSNSKIYIGPDGAKIYCTCTIDRLSKKFSDEEIDKIFKMKPEEIMRATEFAAIECERDN